MEFSMRYHLFASDYDGTLARDGKVKEGTVDKLKQLKATGRKLVLVTGREMRFLVEDFPDYKIFDHVVAENGGVLYNIQTGEEFLLAEPPDPLLVNTLIKRGVQPISVGKVIIATWEPLEHTMLQVIKELGMEKQVIFNKAAVMILPAGVNKASGLQALLDKLHLSWHNTVTIGDAENDGTLIETAECGVAVSNALPSLKKIADLIMVADHEEGVKELIEKLMSDDLASIGSTLKRRFVELGNYRDGSPFAINPYQNGMLVSGVSGAGKTTFTLAIIEGFLKKGYQFCLVDPEGDYLELEGVLVIGNENSLPHVEELISILEDPKQSLVICIISIPLDERPSFFTKFLMAYSKLVYETGHPHWLILDEAHHLLPSDQGPASYPLPADFQNFILISNTPERLSKQALIKVGLLIIVGDNMQYPILRFCNTINIGIPVIPEKQEGEIIVWDRMNNQSPTPVKNNMPQKFLQRHKRKYAKGDMTYNSFVFTGKDNALNLIAGNLIMFAHIGKGIDDNTWLFHLHRKDFTNWFKDKVHDEELSDIARDMEEDTNPERSKKRILGYIEENYTI